jgi:hypothetical protein
MTSPTQHSAPTASRHPTSDVGLVVADAEPGVIAHNRLLDERVKKQREDEAHAARIQEFAQSSVRAAELAEQRPELSHLSRATVRQIARTEMQSANRNADEIILVNDIPDVREKEAPKSAVQRLREADAAASASVQATDTAPRTDPSLLTTPSDPLRIPSEASTETPPQKVVSAPPEDAPVAVSTASEPVTMRSPSSPESASMPSPTSSRTMRGQLSEDACVERVATYTRASTMAEAMVNRHKVSIEVDNVDAAVALIKDQADKGSYIQIGTYVLTSDMWKKKSSEERDLVLKRAGDALASGQRVSLTKPNTTGMQHANAMSLSESISKLRSQGMDAHVAVDDKIITDEDMAWDRHHAARFADAALRSSKATSQEKAFAASYLLAESATDPGASYAAPMNKDRASKALLAQAMDHGQASEADAWADAQRVRDALVNAGPRQTVAELRMSNTSTSAHQHEEEDRAPVAASAHQDRRQSASQNASAPSGDAAPVASEPPPVATGHLLVPEESQSEARMASNNPPSVLTSAQEPDLPPG